MFFSPDLKISRCFLSRFPRRFPIYRSGRWDLWILGVSWPRQEYGQESRRERDKSKRNGKWHYEGGQLGHSWDRDLNLVGLRVVGC